MNGNTSETQRLDGYTATGTTKALFGCVFRFRKCQPIIAMGAGRFLMREMSQLSIPVAILTGRRRLVQSQSGLTSHESLLTFC